MSGDRRVVYNPLCRTKPPFRMMLRLPYTGMLGAEGACHYGDMRMGGAATERPVVPVEQETAVRPVPRDETIRRSASRGARFALTRFRPTRRLSTTLVSRSVLHSRLTAGADKRLTVVVGSAGAGKSVLLSSWAAARPSGMTSWLSCDIADANPVRFWVGFIEAPPGGGAGFRRRSRRVARDERGHVG